MTNGTARKRYYSLFPISGITSMHYNCLVLNIVNQSQSQGVLIESLNKMIKYTASFDIDCNFPQKLMENPEIKVSSFNVS